VVINKYFLFYLFNDRFTTSKIAPLTVYWNKVSEKVKG